MAHRCRFASGRGISLLVLAVVLSLFCSLPGSVAASSLRTLSSDHFRIHTPEELLPMAQQVAVIAEDSYATLSDFFGVEPAGPIHLLISDSHDLPNGMATPFPYNLIIIHATPPGGLPFSLLDTEGWLQIVVLHELTHIFHLDMASGFPRVLRNIFGRTYFPNAASPRWITEGLATRLETEETGGGRGRSSYRDMTIRAAIAEDAFPTLAQAGNPPAFWPGGDIPYLFGVSFYNVLESLSTPDPDDPLDPAARFARAYAGYTLPLQVDRAAKGSYGTPFRLAWLRWQEALKQGAAERPAVASTLVRILSATDESATHPVPSPDGSWLVYRRESSLCPPALVLIDPATGERSAEIRTLSFAAQGRVAWLPDSSAFFYVAIDADRSGSLQGDLYRYELASRCATRLTQGARIAAPALLPDGSGLVAPVLKGGHWRIARFDLDGGSRTEIPLPDAMEYTEVSAHPVDGTLALAVHDTQGRGIILANLEGKVLQRLPLPGRLIGNPSWSQDGARLLFAADPEGKPGIFGWSRDSGLLRRLVEVPYGAYTPSDGGELLFFSSYQARGFQVVVTEEPAMVATAGAPPRDRAPVTMANQAADAAYPVDPYCPLATLLPRYWLPWFGSDEAGDQYGLMTSGNDPAGEHLWAGLLLYGAESDRGAGTFLYRNQQGYPHLQLFASDLAVPYAEFFKTTAGDFDYWEREKRLGADLIFPFAGYWSRRQLSLGYREEQFTSLLDASVAGDWAGEGRLSGLRLGFQLDSRTLAAASITPIDGRMVELSLRADSRDLGGDYDLNRYLVDWSEYFSAGLPQRHGILLKGVWGGSDGDQIYRGAYRLGGDPLGDIFGGIDQTNIPLRGYLTNAFVAKEFSKLTTEYRFPIADLEHGPGNGPVYLRRMHAALFAEGLYLEEGKSTASTGWYRSVGIEGGLDTILGYLAPVTFRVVAVQGFDDRGESQIYLSVRTPLL